MTPTPTLSLRKRYNWSRVFRQHRNRAVAVVIACLIVKFGHLNLELDLTEARLETAESLHKLLVQDVAKYDQPLGAPGTTWTDWKEGTQHWKK